MQVFSWYIADLVLISTWLWKLYLFNVPQEKFEYASGQKKENKQDIRTNNDLQNTTHKTKDRQLKLH